MYGSLIDSKYEEYLKLILYRYTAYAGSSLFGLSSFYSELMKGVGAASRLFELQDRKPSISSTSKFFYATLLVHILIKL